MAKPAFYDSSILFHNSKVQFGCDCCCVDPQVNIIAPSDGRVNYGYGVYGTFSCRALVKFTDTVTLLISTDNGATYQTYGTSGVGLNAFIGGVSGQEPTYGPDNTDLRMTAVITAAPDTQFLFDRPSCIFWKLRVENDCGAVQTESTPRKYCWKSRDDPDDAVDCNDCDDLAGAPLLEEYTMTWSGLDGEMADVFPNGSYTLTNYQSTTSRNQACGWVYTAAGGETMYLRYFGGPLKPVWEVRLNVDIAASPFCFVRLRKDTSTESGLSFCDPPSYWTYAADDSYVTPSSAAGCSPASTLTNIVVTVS